MRARVLPLALALLALGFGGAAYRSWSIGYPLFPRITERLWEARLSVDWAPGQAPVSARIPRGSPRQEIRDERFFSGPLEATVAADLGANRRLVWEGEGATAAVYQAEILVRDAPLGTYLGWNITAAGFHQGKICNYAGGMIPFAKTEAERLAKGDPRLSLEERYKTHAGYVEAVKAAAAQAVTQGFLLQEDADALVKQAAGSSVLNP